jgi:hypothetical protein
MITLRHTTLSRTRLDKWSAQCTELSLTAHSTQVTDIHAIGSIQTRNPSKRVAADPRLRPRGHWDWLMYGYYPLRCASLNAISLGSCQMFFLNVVHRCYSIELVSECLRLSLLPTPYIKWCPSTTSWHWSLSSWVGGDGHASQGGGHSLGQNYLQFAMRLNVVKHIEAGERQFNVWKMLHSGKDSNSFNPLKMKRICFI